MNTVLVLLILIIFFPGCLANQLVNQLVKGKIPPDGNLLPYIVIQFLISLTYRFIIPSDSFDTWKPQNSNEEKIMKLIKLIRDISKVAIAVLLILLAYIIIPNFNKS